MQTSLSRYDHRQIIWMRMSWSFSLAARAIVLLLLATPSLCSYSDDDDSILQQRM